MALARALAPAPRVLLLDEPLGALDRPLRERLVDELRGLFARLGLTVVAVTHDQRRRSRWPTGSWCSTPAASSRPAPPPRCGAQPRTRAVAELLGFTNVVAARVAADGC